MKCILVSWVDCWVLLPPYRPAHVSFLIMREHPPKTVGVDGARVERGVANGGPLAGPDNDLQGAGCRGASVSRLSNCKRIILRCKDALWLRYATTSEIEIGGTRIVASWCGMQEWWDFGRVLELHTIIQVMLSRYLGVRRRMDDRPLVNRTVDWILEVLPLGVWTTQDGYAECQKPISDGGAFDISKFLRRMRTFLGDRKYAQGLRMGRKGSVTIWIRDVWPL
ncbi:hypothetical protein GGR55DRAFT_132215 [Xylaria sp. FL0064]|nr:hypothetical protein GGR55DRAFT_132215 [Xylaria sp. FL0064]